MNRVRVGVLGTGAIMREFHMPALAGNPRVEVAAAGNLHEASLAKFAQDFGILKTYTNLDLMALDPEIDAVVIGLPNYLHAPIAIKMLQAEKHVLCEKPMALTVAEAQAMVNAADESGRKLVIAHVWRSNGEICWLRDVIRGGWLGPVFKVKAHAILAGRGPSLNSWFVRPELAGGGVLMDIGIHSIDTISFLFNDSLRPSKVLASIGAFFQPTEVEDTATAIIEYDTGMLAVIEAGWYHNFSENPHGALEVFGTNGYGRVFPSELYCRIEGAWGKYRPTLPTKHSHNRYAMGGRGFRV